MSDIAATQHANIHAAKLAVMAEVPYIRKQKAQDLKYTFAGEAELVAHLHPSFVKHGITISPVKVRVEHQGDYTTRNGSLMHHIRLTVTYKLSHAASGTFDYAVGIGEAADAGDKTCPKAMTGAYKYALRQAFLIETGDDPDRTPSERQQGVSKQQAGQSSQNQTKPPAGPISKPQLEQLKKEIGAAGLVGERYTKMLAWFADRYKIAADLAAIPAVHFQDALVAIRRAKAGTNGGNGNGKPHQLDKRQAEEIRNLFAKLNWPSDEQCAYLEYYKAGTIEQLSDDQAANVIRDLADKAKPRKEPARA